MVTHPLIPVILCGGAGSRLWPLSRKSLPKPFIPLPDGETLFEKTAKRAAAVCGETGQAVVVTQQELAYAVQEHLASLAGKHVSLLLEPVGRDTAAAIAVAVASLHHQGVERSCPLLFMPADHLISPLEQFTASVKEALQRAEERDALALLGVQPTAPETGFGYIRVDHNDNVLGFIEKPEKSQAANLLLEGALWNSGMFAGSLGLFISLFEQHAPEIWQAACQAVRRAEQVEEKGLAFWRLNDADYAHMPVISFDYAIVEKVEPLVAVRATFQWSDVGAWGALFEQVAPDDAGNRVYLQDKVSQACVQTGRNVSIWAEGERMVAVCGVDEVIVVDMPDVVLVTQKKAAGAVKQLYNQLLEKKHPVTLDNPYTVRPWGYYVVLLSMPTYKVKKIMVKPGHQLSYQLHRHRQENWVVVSGEAVVILEDNPHSLAEGETIFIPQGAKHRLINQTDKGLEVIEVQYGTYLGEDDIERIEDDYIR